MSIAAAPDARVAAAPAASGRPMLADRPGIVVLIGFMLTGALSWPHLVTIWQDNTFFDTDDAMRLVQVRNWLDGQGWFDLVEHRLFPPAGLLMHWSRIVDVPVGGLIRLFEIALEPDRAERAARIVFPLVLQGALIAVTVTAARILMGAAATIPAMILIVLSGFSFEQFPPGRIDHHAPQITLLVLMTASILAALETRRAPLAAVAALAIAVSLGISLENLPFIVVVASVLPLAWLADPAGLRRPMLWFAAALVLAAPAVFLGTVPPSRYGAVVGDAYCIAHLAGLMAGSAGLAALALGSPRLSTVPRRLLALAFVAAIVGGGLIAVFPTCLHDPYASMDPVLKSIWLDHVTEAQPMLAAIKARPDTLTMLFCPLLCGALGAAAAAWRERGLARVRWGVVLTLILVGMAGSFWQVRVVASTQPLAALGGVWVVTRALATAARRGSAAGQVLAFALVAPFATLAWAFVPSGQGDNAAAEALAQGRSCRTAEALAPLGALPPGLVFAPIDDGSHLLVATPHSVVAAPYHRNQHGNRLVIDGFMAAPAQAEAIVRGTGARYVALCPGEVQIGVLARRAPGGLGAALIDGRVPPWLTPVPLGATPYRVFALAPAAG